MALVFPITRPPKPPWTWETEDNLLKSPTDSGFVISRPRYTRARDTLEMTWDLLDTEMLVLDNFYKSTTACGSLEFELTIVTDRISITKTVQFTKPPTNTYQGIGVFETKCSFREV